MERHLAAILYADVAGYNRLTVLYEKETHEQFNAGLSLLISTIREHNGQTIHEAGDAILAEFSRSTYTGYISRMYLLVRRVSPISILIVIRKIEAC